MKTLLPKTVHSDILYTPCVTHPPSGGSVKASSSNQLYILSHNSHPRIDILKKHTQMIVGSVDSIEY